MTEQELLSEIQLALLEPVDGGASFPSEAWTREEVLDAVSSALRALCRQTSVLVAYVERPVSIFASSVTLPADWIATIHLVWRTNDYQTEILADDPEGYWRMNEVLGASTVLDYGPNGLNGSYAGGVTQGVTGALADGTTAAAFDGATGLADMGDQPTLNVTGPFTLEIWSRFTVGSSQRVLMGKSNWETTAVGWTFLQQSGKFRIYAATAASATVLDLTTVNAYNDGAYHLVAVTWDGTTNLNGLKIYVDGSLERQGTANAGTIGLAAAPFRLGMASNGTNPLYAYNGVLDEAVFYNAELSGIRLFDHYAARLLAASQRVPLGPADAFEADLVLGAWDSAGGRGRPIAYADLDTSTLTLRLVPTPDASGTLEIIYAVRPTSLVGSIAPLPVPDEFLSAEKYGALQTLLEKVGRMQDPDRASYCGQRVEIATMAAELLLRGGA